MSKADDASAAVQVSMLTVDQAEPGTPEEVAERHRSQRVEKRVAEIEKDVRLASAVRIAPSSTPERLAELAALQDEIIWALRAQADAFNNEGSYYEAARALCKVIARRRKADLYRGIPLIEGGLVKERAEWEIRAEDELEEEADRLHGERERLWWQDFWNISRSEQRWGPHSSLQGVCYIHMQRDRPDRWTPIVVRAVRHGAYAGNLEAPQSFASLADAKAWAEAAIYNEIHGVAVVKGGLF